MFIIKLKIVTTATNETNMILRFNGLKKFLSKAGISNNEKNISGALVL